MSANFGAVRDCRLLKLHRVVVQTTSFPMVPDMHGCRKVCDSLFSISLTTSPFSLFASHSSCSLLLLDFLHVLAFGNEMLGKRVSWVVFVNDEGAVEKFPDTFQRKKRERLANFLLLPVSLRTCQQSSDMSLAGIEQLQEIVAEFDSADKFDDEWFIQRLHTENRLLL